MDWLVLVVMTDQSVCCRVRCDNKPEYCGIFSPSESYSGGRVMFYNQEHGTWLCHHPTTSVWTITARPDCQTAGVLSARSTVCPADPVARGGRGWQYWDQGWRTDPSITVTCRNHKYRNRKHSLYLI